MVKEFNKSGSHDEHLTDTELKTIFSQQVRKFMNKQVRFNEKAIKSSGKTGTSSIVDYIMYLSIVFVFGFGFMAYKKLKDQNDTLVI